MPRKTKKRVAKRRKKKAHRQGLATQRQGLATASPRHPSPRHPKKRASCPTVKKTKRLADGPWIQREGKLGGPGYTYKGDRERRRILRCSLERFGYRSTLGSLLVLLRAKTSKKVAGVVRKDLAWIKDNKP